jgi:hypothetical protein
VRDSDLAGLQAVLIHDVLLGGEEQPHGLVVERSVLVIGVIVTDQGLLGRRLFLLLLGRLDMAQQGGGSFDNLRENEISMRGGIFSYCRQRYIPEGCPAGMVSQRPPWL